MTKAFLYILLIFLSSCEVRDYPKPLESYNKTGTLYIEWADGKTEIYKGEFRDFPDKVILLNASFVKHDTLVSDTLLLYPEDWYPEPVFIDSLVQGKMKYRYLQTDYIKAMKTELIKAQMKRVWIK
jgi:hypothetical protein